MKQLESIHYKINQTLIKKIAVQAGLSAKGYKYVNLDDCWQIQRNATTKQIIQDKRHFPSGIKSLAEYFHKKGLKFGLYSDAGQKTCQGRSGSLGCQNQMQKLTLLGKLIISNMITVIKIILWQGGWNDPDMLKVGNGEPLSGMSIDQQYDHFALWCILKSPLLIGQNLLMMSQRIKTIIGNQQLITMNQEFFKKTRIQNKEKLKSDLNSIGMGVVNYLITVMFQDRSRNQNLNQHKE